MIVMLVLLFLLVVVAVILMESRMGRLRWLLAETAERTAKLEGKIGDLQHQVALLRGSPVGLPSPQPSPEADAPVAGGQPKAQATVPTPAAPVAVAPAGAGSVPPVTPPTPPSPPTTASPPPSGASLEERLGTRWAVWVGGVALALGALLMVRFAIEQGFFGPAARIAMAGLFSLALLASGEWFRRSGFKPSLDAIPAAHIPSVLTAAGSTGLFGTVYAAYGLYEFIGPAVAFILLGIVGVGTMLGSALHGPALAGLGLVGAYVAPLLVSTPNPRPWPVVIYLAVVAATALGLARIRQWLWLALIAIAGAFVWGLVFVEPMLFRSFEWTLGGYLHTLIQLALAAAAIAVLPHFGRRDHDAQPDAPAVAALAPMSLLAVIMLGAGRYDLASAVPFTLAVAAILLATAWISARAALGAILAGVVVLASILIWPGLRAVADKTYLLHEVAGVLLVPDNVVSYLTFASLAALAVTAVATLRLMRGQALPLATAALYALAATLTPLLVLVLVYLRVTLFDTSISFAFAASVLGVVFALLADRFQRTEIDVLPGTQLATGAFASAAIAALSFGLVAALSRGYLTVALSLAALGTAYVAVRRDVPALRHVVTALAAVVLARLAWDPRIMGSGVGSWPILNWLLVGYGVPAVAFYSAARLLERKGADTPARLADAAAVLLAGLLCFFEIHHAMHAGDALAARSGHVEIGLLALVGFGLSYALMRLDLGRANPVFHYGSIGYGALSTLGALVGLGLVENPLFTRDLVVGPTVFSSLLVAYLLPGLAAVLLARASRPWRPAPYVTGIAIAAVLLIFGYVTLEVRHAFQGADIRLSMRRASGPEMWAYSMAWLWLGLVFLAYGIFRGSLEARIASAALVLLTVFKVFVFDLSGITGLWRALSFIGLGVVLIGIGLAYQHLLFPPRRPPPQVLPAPSPEPTAP